MNRFLLGLAFWAATPLAAHAGTTGSISGIVLDVSVILGTPSPVADVKITVISEAQTASTTTDSRGMYAFASLVPGSYTLLVEKSGWNTQAFLGVLVAADQDFRISPHLTRESMVIVHMDGPFSFFGLSMGLGAGHTADSYGYSERRTTVGYGPLVDLQWLRFTPGITFALSNAALSSPL